MTSVGCQVTRRPRHAVGDRIADEQDEHGRDAGDPHAAEIGAGVEIVLGQPEVVVEGQLLDAVDEPGQPLPRSNVGT